jgi:hypothetical protein
MNTLNTKNIVKSLAIGGCLLSSNHLLGALDGRFPPVGDVGVGNAREADGHEIGHGVWGQPADAVGNENLAGVRALGDGNVHVVDEADRVAQALRLGGLGDIETSCAIWHRLEAKLKTINREIGKALLKAERGEIGEVVKVLIGRVLGVGVRRPLEEELEGSTPLHLAAKCGCQESVEVFIRGGAGVNAKDDNGETPLFLATLLGHEQIVRVLLGRGADVNVRGFLGKTPLHLAALRGYGPIVRMLLDRGAEVNVRDNKGRTPLYSAASQGYEWIVRMLLDRGADVNAENDEGYGPLDVALNKVIADLLKSRGARRWYQFWKN